MSYQEMSVRELIGVKREIQERLTEAQTAETKAQAQAQKDLNELDTALKSKLDRNLFR